MESLKNLEEKKVEAIETLEELKGDLELHMNDASCDFVVDCELDYIDYLDDAISEFADNYCDIYYHQLIDWLKEEPEAFDYCDRYITECCGCVPEFSKIITGAQYYYYFEKLQEDADEIMQILAIKKALELIAECDNLPDSEKVIDYIQSIQSDSKVNVIEFDLEELFKRGEAENDA